MSACLCCRAHSIDIAGSYYKPFHWQCLQYYLAFRALFIYYTNTVIKISLLAFLAAFLSFSMFHGPDNRQLRNPPLGPIICLHFVCQLYAIKIFILDYFVLLLDASCKGNLTLFLNGKLCIMNCLCFYWIIISFYRTSIYN